MPLCDTQETGAFPLVLIQSDATHPAGVVCTLIDCKQYVRRHLHRARLCRYDAPQLSLAARQGCTTHLGVDAPLAIA